MLTTSDIRAINREFRSKDESHLWPISGKFNATNRAIRRIRDLQAQGLVIDDPLSYAQILDDEISAIVNGEV